MLDLGIQEIRLRRCVRALRVVDFALTYMRAIVCAYDKMNDIDDIPTGAPNMSISHRCSKF